MSADNVDDRADRMARLADEILALPRDERAAATDKLSPEDLLALRPIIAQKEAALRERDEADDEALARALAGGDDVAELEEAHAWAQSQHPLALLHVGKMALATVRGAREPVELMATLYGTAKQNQRVVIAALFAAIVLSTGDEGPPAIRELRDQAQEGGE